MIQEALLMKDSEIEAFQKSCPCRGARTPAGGDVSKQVGAQSRNSAHQAEEAPTNHLRPALSPCDTRSHVEFQVETNRRHEGQEMAQQIDFQVASSSSPPPRGRSSCCQGPAEGDAPSTGT